MWQALIKLVEKWACMHDMKLVTDVYENGCTQQIYVCSKCGKIKKVKL